MGVARLSVQLILYTLLFAAAIILLPGIPPELKFGVFRQPNPKPFEGKLAPNEILHKAEALVEGEFVGPETVAFKGNQVYTGVVGGAIIKIDGETGKWSKVVQLGPTNCDGTWKSPCSRPMGVRFSANGKLYVTDAYFGLFEVDVTSGKATQLLSEKVPLSDGIPVNYLNDLDIDNKEGKIYFTDTSTLVKFHSAFADGLGDASGRLLSYDLKTKKTEVLLSNIHYANGVQLSKSGEFLVLVESIRSTVWKYYIKGPKKGTKELLIDGLPGLPDNVRSNGKNGFYISLVLVDSEKEPSAFRLLGPIPAVRKLVLKTQHLLLKLVDMIHNVWSHETVTAVYHWICHLGPIGSMQNLPRKVTIVEVDEAGNILRSFQNSNNKMGLISNFEVGEKYGFFGTPYDNKLWRIKKEFLQ